MARTKLGSNATLTNVGKGLTVVGDHCYAYTGVVGTGASGTFAEYLNFHSGKGYIKGRLMVQYAVAVGDSIEWQIIMNGLNIAVSESAHQVGSDTFVDFVDLIIPPLTNVIWKITNLSGSTAHDVTCTFTGRVYA